MTSAVDIITYIGVPLAVIGVMPVMYTCFLALLTRSRVLRTINKNHLQATTHVSLLSGVIEVEFPRFTIHPLPRDDPLYWQKHPEPSAVRGGSWSLMNWQKVPTGRGVYRIQHSDELRQPQAEIQLTDLVTYLLDRGATPSPHGIHLLRIMGLQTPPSTPLLVCSGRPVLLVSSPDESEGRLSLRLQWNSELNLRSPNSLPPYWIRLAPGKRSPKLKDDESVEDDESDPTRPPVRLYLGLEGLEAAKSESLLGDEIHDMKEGAIDHLLPLRHASSSPATALWFASAVVAVCRQNAEDSQISLFRFVIPPHIVAFSKRDTIPHGVLVVMGMREEEETPMSAERRRLRQAAQMDRTHRDLTLQRELAQKMMTASPADKMKYQQENSQRMLSRMREENQTRAEDELQRKSDALVSPRVGNRVVAEAALVWLKAQGRLSSDVHQPEPTLHAVALSAVHMMIFDDKMAEGIAKLLDSWIGWVDIVMNDVHFDILRDNQEWFCYAAILVHQIAEYEFNGSVNPVAKDLDECQRVWKGIYLG